MRFVSLVIFTTLISSAALAQVVGASVSGIVKDATGAGLPGTVVTIHNLENGADRVLTSDEGGRYSAPSIPVGNYQITASKEGFASQVKTGIALVVAQHSTVDIELQVGELKQVVTVEESSSPVNMSTQETAGLVSERQMKDLPLNGRSFDLLMTLNPAVVNYTAGRSGGVGTSSSSLGNQFAVSGRRAAGKSCTS